MTETAIVHLHLNQVQRAQWFAHIMTYMYSCTLNPELSRARANRDLIQDVGRRLFGLWGDERAEVAFSLSQEESQEMHMLFATLQGVYEQWPAVETSVLALEHLAACRSLLEEAKHHLSNGTSEGEQVG